MGKAAIIGARVKRLRENLEMGQYELAQLSGHSQGHISSIEKGNTQSVGIEVLVDLTRALKTNIEYLIGASNDPRPHPRSIFDTLTVDQAELLDNYMALDPPLREKLQNEARWYRKVQIEEIAVQSPPPPDKIEDELS